MSKYTIARSRGAPQAKGYSEAGASMTRRALRGFIPESGAPSEDIGGNNATLRKRSRLLYMSAPLATSAIATNATKVVGVGLTLKSTVAREILGLSQEQAKEWQRKTETEWKVWAEDKRACDALGLNTFTELQQIALKSSLLNGDAFVPIVREPSTLMRPYSLRLHLIEADRVCTPFDLRGAIFASRVDGKATNGNRIHDGVEINAVGKVVAYHVCNVYPHQRTADGKSPEWTRVTVEGEHSGMPNILHIIAAERAEQYRGVPFLAPVIEPLLQMRRYTESEILAALVQTFFTAVVTTEADPSQLPFNEVGAGEIAGIPVEPPQREELSSSPNELQLSPGGVLTLKPGEDVKFGNPNIPMAGFDTFIKTFATLVGSALELPREVLLKEFNSSYSASRGALLEAWEAMKTRRAWFVSDFCKPVYEMWLAEAVARGRIKAPGFFDDPLIRAAWCGARWIGPVQGQLDPLKEAKAAVIQINHGLKTHSYVAREIGSGDWDENMDELERENERIKSAFGALPGDDHANDEDEEEDEK